MFAPADPNHLAAGVARRGAFDLLPHRNSGSVAVAVATLAVPSRRRCSKNQRMGPTNECRYCTTLRCSLRLRMHACDAWHHGRTAVRVGADRGRWRWQYPCASCKVLDPRCLSQNTGTVVYCTMQWHVDRTLFDADSSAPGVAGKVAPSPQSRAPDS